MHHLNDQTSCLKRGIAPLKTNLKSSLPQSILSTFSLLHAQMNQSILPFLHSLLFKLIIHSSSSISRLHTKKTQNGAKLLFAVILSSQLKMVLYFTRASFLYLPLFRPILSTHNMTLSLLAILEGQELSTQSQKTTLGLECTLMYADMLMPVTHALVPKTQGISHMGCSNHWRFPNAHGRLSRWIS
jgi:hypothetical protein